MFFYGIILQNSTLEIEDNFLGSKNEIECIHTKRKNIIMRYNIYIKLDIIVIRDLFSYS